MATPQGRIRKNRGKGAGGDAVYDMDAGAPPLPQPSPAQPQGPGSHLDALNGALKIGPKDGHKGLQVQNPGDRGLAGTGGPLQSAVCHRRTPFRHAA